MLSEDTLLSAMETAGADEMPENAERKGIGTSATRADTIEILIKREYIVRKDKQLLPTDKGFCLIKVLPDSDSIKSPMLTAKWESDLQMVEREEMTADSFIDAINRYVVDTIKAKNTVSEEYKALFPSSVNSGVNGEVIGKCPWCGNDVTETPKAFSCIKSKDKTCAFILWKENKYFKSKKKSITKAVAKALLDNGQVYMKDLYSETKGKTYNATIFLDDKKGDFVSFRMEFEQKAKK